MLMSIKLKPWNKWGVLAIAPHSHFSLVCQGLLPFYCNSKFQSAAQERILAFQSGQLHTHMHSPLNSVLKALWKNACRISKRWLTRFEGMELYEILTTQPGALVEVNLKYAPSTSESADNAHGYPGTHACLHLLQRTDISSFQTQR